MSFPLKAALLVFVSNPDHAILLLLCGILFIYAEFNKPGTVLFGCFGALLMMFALYGLGHLALSRPALMLTILGMVLVGIACRFPLYRVPDIAGTLCIALGLANLVVSPKVHFIVAIVCAAIFSFVTTWLVRIALSARQNKSLVGPQALIGHIAVVLVPLTPSGQVEVCGEIWSATLQNGQFQPAGACLIVRNVNGSELLVESDPASSSSA